MSLPGADSGAACEPGRRPSTSLTKLAVAKPTLGLAPGAFVVLGGAGRSISGAAVAFLAAPATAVGGVVVLAVMLEVVVVVVKVVVAVVVVFEIVVEVVLVLV